VLAYWPAAILAICAAIRQIIAAPIAAAFGNVEIGVPDIVLRHVSKVPTSIADRAM
jgi:hypothetical protein